MNFKVSEESEENFDSEVQLAASMVCPRAASPPWGASLGFVFSCAWLFDFSARPSAQQVAHRQVPAEKGLCLAFFGGVSIFGFLCLSASFFRACGGGDFPTRQ